MHEPRHPTTHRRKHRRRDRPRYERVPDGGPPGVLGRASVPATTSRPGSVARAGPAKAASGSTTRSRTRRSPRSAPTTATSKPSTGARSPSSVTAARSAPSSTRSSAPAGTCSPPARSTTTSAATTSPAATPNARPDGSSHNSNDSDTTSPFSRRLIPHFPSGGIHLAAVDSCAHGRAGWVGGGSAGVSGHVGGVPRLDREFFREWGGCSSTGSFSRP